MEMPMLYHEDNVNNVAYKRNYQKLTQQLPWKPINLSTPMSAEHPRGPHMT